MQLIHRPIDITADRDYILERHCRINYECDCPWKRVMSYDDYRSEYFGLQGQINGYLGALAESINDPRTIAEIIADESGETIAYLWVPFNCDEESGFAYADVSDIYVEEAYRGRGIATGLMEYVEVKAKLNGATVIRSGTGCENTASIEMHNKLGYYQYRYEFEKKLQL